ncbi:response regulator transcription factor [Tsukamurella tyrosinosolvens]|mgnify:CR=1 FL=1|uniref:Response regulator transcription factor n=1 Tax=Tsukamurella columbiensis TaxID=128509 RepID=A0ABX1LJT4_9ACTN|nr:MULTISPECIES: response regulator transcription factor [Tsukamurella]KXP01903.1 LuxR family transcriptional regulator [Tsukamurella tyrosinosolvens]KZL94529.1 LuxR family transcriptional regulator [Tsukamurella tyrosinosolvens]MCA4997434.1 response regulator transcription factor [Tsukamurella tyrosinosolvens]NMD58559.1 response regulator transcription factor [Tsukamurella columbiensis]
MITVFLVDDHEVVRRGVADLLDDEDDLTVVGQAGTAAEALVRIPAQRPDIAVLDVRLPDGNGVELCRDLRSVLPQLNCLMLTSFTDEQAMLDAIMAGAGGYAIKDIRGMELLEAVRTVGRGGSLLDTRAAAAVMKRLREPTPTSPLDALTEQEKTLLNLIGEGLTNRQIAQQMCLAEKTIKNYVSKLLAKLDLERRTQAAALATRLGQPRVPGR